MYIVLTVMMSVIIVSFVFVMIIVSFVFVMLIVSAQVSNDCTTLRATPGRIFRPTNKPDPLHFSFYFCRRV